MAENLAGNLPAEDEIFLVNVNHRLSIKKPIWARDIIGKGAFSHVKGIKGFLYDVARSRTVIDELRAALARREGAKVVFYIPNIHHVLTNNIFFSLRNDFPSHEISFSVLVEGSLNYVGYKLGFSYFPAFFVKSLVSLAFGLRYRPFIGSFCGDDRSDVTTVYSPSIFGMDDLKDKIKVVEFSSSVQSTSGRGRVLMLGQYLDSQIGGAKAKVISDSFLFWAKKNFSFADLDYKGHPLHRDLYMESRVIEAGGTVIENTDPVEVLLSREHPYSQVVSVASSGLFMAKIMLGDRINCTAFGLEYLHAHARHDYSRLKSLYKFVGIDCREISDVG